MAKIMTPAELVSRGLYLKKLLGCTSKEAVQIGNIVINIHGELLCNHDLYHLEVSCLPRIQIGKYQVSGIHGINLPVFHDFPIVTEYDSFLDEARIACHEWLTRTSPYNTLKLIGWMLWLITQGINPINVLIRHYRVLNRDIILIPVICQMSFCDENK